MDPSIFTPYWIEGLLNQYDDEVKEESQWPILLLETTVRIKIWSMCSLFGVSSRGVPGAACRLLERYLCRHVRDFLLVTPDRDEWERYKQVMESRFQLVVAACVMLAAKMSEVQAPVSASVVRLALLRDGHAHARDELTSIEWHVYRTLEFRIPLWTTTEMAQFLAWQSGVRSAPLLEAVALVANLLEFHRNQLETHLRCGAHPVPEPHDVSPSSPLFPDPPSGAANKCTLHNLHLSAAAVCAGARYMLSPHDPADTLATLTRCTSFYINTISDIVLKYIMPAQHHIPSIFKRRRLK